MIAAVLRRASRPSGKQIVRWLHRLITAIRGHWPLVEIMLRADSHYCTPEVPRFCRVRGLDYTLGVAPPQPFHVLTHMEPSAAPPTSTLRKHVLSLEHSTAARAATAADGTKLRRFKESYDGAGPRGTHRRARGSRTAGHRHALRLTSLIGPSGRTVYQDIHCARGQAENHIKAWKTRLAADRTSCCRASANQFRLFLHVGAYWLMWSLRTPMPRRSRWRMAQFDTLRLRPIKLAVRIEGLKTKVRLHSLRATPDQALFALLLSIPPP